MQHFQNAQWIFPANVEGPVVDRYFRYETKLTAPAGQGVLYISAHSQYAVYVNGTFVDCGQYDDYEHLQFYDALELSRYLRPGVNDLTICQYVCGVDTSTHGVQIPGVIFAVWDGEASLLASTPAVASCEDLRYAGNGELFTGQLGFNFSCDATKAPTALKPSALAGKEKNLHPRPIEKCTIEPLQTGTIVAQGVFMENDPALPKAIRLQTAYLSARRHGELFTGPGNTWHLSEDCRADGVYVVADMGGEMTGLLLLEIDVPQQTEILIAIGEHLDDLRVRSFVGGRNLALRYVAKAGHNVFFHPFQRMGLRYIQLQIGSRSGTLHGVGLRPMMYPVTVLPNPMTDRLHRRIWDVGVKTLRLCMHEHYEDCPWREQALYAMDSRVQILCGYYAFGEYDFPRAALSLMAHSLRPDGLLALCPPGKGRVDIPAFTAVYVREVWEYTRFSKDRTLAREVLPTLQAICDGFIGRLDGRGLIPPYRGEGMWNFYEWQEGLCGYEPYSGQSDEAPLCAFVTDALRCCSRILLELGMPGAERYEQAARDLAEATHRRFFDPTSGGYRTRPEDAKPLHALTQALMLFADVAPAEVAPTVAELLAGESLIPCSVSMTIYAYEGLLKQGCRYRNDVVKHIDSVWGRMLAKGADTFWETERGADDFDYAGSLCHGWSAVPIYIFGHYGLPGT